MSFASDTFTDTAATALPSHTMDSGGPWVSHGSYNDNGVISGSNRARSNSATLTFGYYATQSPASADYDVEADLFVASAAGSMGVAGRMSTSADTMYFARYNSSTSRWELFSLVAGSATSLGTFSQALTVGNSYHIKLEMRGTAIKVYIDGVQRISVTSSAVTAAGKAGIRGTGGAGGGTNSTSYHLDNFSSTNAGGASYTGSATLSITDAITTAGVRRRHGATTTALTDTVTTAGKLNGRSATTTAVTDGITTAAKVDAHSASTTPLSFSATTAGLPTLHGSSTTPLTFSASTDSTRTGHGDATLNLTDTIATSGVLGAHSTSTLPITFQATTAAGGHNGQATLNLTDTITTDGLTRAYSTSTLPLQLTFTSAAGVRGYGTATLNELFAAATAGVRRGYGTVEFDETILITTIPGGNLILGAMIQGELAFTSIGIIAPNHTGDIDYR